MNSKVFEVNFEGLVGPTHNYSGLSYGNVASLKHQNKPSNPREAALQGLHKMKTLADLGVKQAVIPPQARPQLGVLRQIGFTGADHEVIIAAGKQVPEIFRACVSASSMWTANAATMAPSTDTADKKVHFTPANLSEKFHRSLEWETTGRILKAIFKSETHFAHHEALPAGAYFGDEGAANHTRFAPSHSDGGLHFFVFGRYGFQPTRYAPRKFPARQTFEASAAIARLHRLDPKQVIFAQQHPDLIDAGVFHNDVAAVGNENVFLYHQMAYLDSKRVIGDLKKHYQARYQQDLICLEVSNDEVSIEEAIQSYLFNSQLVTLKSGKMILVAPEDSERSLPVRTYLDKLVASPHNPIERVHYFDLRQSMSNGGGPACLRFRVLLNETELNHTEPGVLFNPGLYQKLVAWVTAHYRECLRPEDIYDPALWREDQQALDALTGILNLGSIYDFQRGTL